MSGNGIPAVVPPMGGRRPLGGGEAPTLGVGAPIPQQQFAPVPPVQPQTQLAIPPWAQQATAPQPTPEQLLDQKFPASEQELVLGGLKAGAPASEILAWFKQWTLEDLGVLAARHGLGLSTAAPAVEQAAPALPPVAAAHAPVAQASANAGLAQQAQTEAQQLAQRVTKKHWPAIEQAMRANANATAEEIAAALKIPVEGTRKVMKDLALKIGAEAVAGGAGVLQNPAAPVAGDGYVEGILAKTQDVPVERRTYTPSVEPGKWARQTALLDQVEALAQANGCSYLEIEAAAVFLGMQRR